jgi:hypothetical protein
MNKATYKAYQRSIKDNGLRYTLAHAPKLDGYALAKLDILYNMEDPLEWRVRWLNQPDTTRLNILKLTSPYL